MEMLQAGLNRNINKVRLREKNFSYSECKTPIIINHQKKSWKEMYMLAI